MKYYILITLSVLFGLQALAQRDLTPGKKKDAFGGARNFKDYSLNGIQFQLGGTFLLNRLNNNEIDVDIQTGGFRGTYLHDPVGRLGIYGEVGMFHFPKKFPKLRISKEKVITLVSYYDWGIGFKYFRGAEDMTLNYEDAVGNSIGEDELTYNFSNGNVYGRFSVHKNIYFKGKKRKKKLNFFLDNSLGLNFDYRVLTNSDEYTNGYSITTSAAQYYKPFYAQMHYGLGFGFSPRRGMFIVPGVRIPFLGYHSTVAAVNDNAKGENYFGKASLHWFSSRYHPLLFHVKFMFSLPKRQKGCKTGITNDMDKETQKNR